MAFDYENAERDIFDSGADPDYLDYKNPEKRDAYLRSLGMNPEKYGGGSRDPWYKTHGNPSSSSGSGCFLTQACTVSRGLPDDCEELTVLRRYRDEILLRQAGGRAEVAHYYEIAPDIVDRINRREDARQVWETVYDEMIAPCVSFIKQAEYDKAFLLYRSYTLRLSRTY